MRGHGSVDFREIVYRHQIEAMTQTSVIEQVWALNLKKFNFPIFQLKKEMELLDNFFNNSENYSNNTLKEKGILISGKLKLLRQVKDAMSVRNLIIFKIK